MSCQFLIDDAVNSTLQIQNGASVNFSIANVSIGYHNWSVNCIDLAGNGNRSSPYYFNLTPPDLAIYRANMTINTSSFEENRNFTVTANISNIGAGDAQNVLIEFLNNSADGNVLKSETADLKSGDNVTVNLTIAYPIGTYAVVVRVDGQGKIPELNEENNIANLTFTIPLWNEIVGNITGDFQITGSDSLARIFAWDSAENTEGNVFAADIDSDVEWTSLVALSRNVTGNYSADDFGQP